LALGLITFAIDASNTQLILPQIMTSLRVELHQIHWALTAPGIARTVAIAATGGIPAGGATHSLPALYWQFSLFPTLPCWRRTKYQPPSTPEAAAVLAHHAATSNGLPTPQASRHDNPACTS